MIIIAEICRFLTNSKFINQSNICITTWSSWINIPEGSDFILYTSLYAFWFKEQEIFSINKKATNNMDKFFQHMKR